MTKVIITSREVAWFKARFLDVLEGAGFSPVYPADAPLNQPTDAELYAALDGVEASLAGSELYNAKLFDTFPKLKVIARVGVGYDAVDVAAATARGIAVTIAPNTNQGSVAEHTFALILGLTSPPADSTRSSTQRLLAVAHERAGTGPDAWSGRPGPDR